LRDARDALIRLGEGFNVFLFDPEAQAALEAIAPAAVPRPNSTSRRRREPAPAPAPAPAEDHANGKLTPVDVPSGEIKLGKGERTVLNVLAQYPAGRTYKELAFLAGYSAKASTLGVILANLRRANYVTRSGDPRLTETGLQSLGHVDALPSGPELLDHWLRHPRMGQGERTVLRTLIDLYPNEPSHEELCEITGYSSIASTMGVILAKLRKLGLVEKGARRLAQEFYTSIQAVERVA
jgi:hypothetical protein